jgi:uncharacterized protein YjbJ (UPF0337 family)
VSVWYENVDEGDATEDDCTEQNASDGVSIHWGSLPNLAPLKRAEDCSFRQIVRCEVGSFSALRTLSWQQQKELHMDKDRVEGVAEQAKGKVKEVAGKVTGDTKTEAEGKADQVKGKIQNTVGGIKDTLREK